MNLLLSLFPGIDLLGRGFEAEGFSVVRGPDLIWGQDVRSFHIPAGRFNGIIAGSPCPDFSKARRSAPSGEGIEMLREFIRIVLEGLPEWFLLENVPGVPDLEIPNYIIQRFDLDARECGSKQRRRRHFQFGSLDGRQLVIRRRLTSQVLSQYEPTCMATEGRKENRRSWSDFCELQGLPRDFDLPGWPREFKYRAVGNGVPVPMARMIAEAVREASILTGERLCLCGCARPVDGRQSMATAACRKRMERGRRAPREIITS